MEMDARPLQLNASESHGEGSTIVSPTDGLR